MPELVLLFDEEPHRDINLHNEAGDLDQAGVGLFSPGVDYHEPDCQGQPPGMVDRSWKLFNESLR